MNEERLECEHVVLSPVRERERERKGKREREKERGRERTVIFIFKRNDRCLDTF